MSQSEVLPISVRPMPMQPIPAARRFTKGLLELAATAPVDGFTSSNRDVAEAMSAVLSRVRVTHEPCSHSLSLAITRADWWTRGVAEVLALEDLPFALPHVTASPDDEVVMEWWRGARKLTVYVTAGAAEFVRVWGANIFEDMDDGVIDGPREMLVLWRWLNDPS
jgi:hypothetical protein